MPPPASAFKKAPKKEEPPLSAIVVLDVFDQRFAPIHQSYPCFGLVPVCNVPVINFTLTWLMRTEVKVVMLVVSGLNAKYAELVQKEWKSAFEELNIIACDGATSLGDCMRELNNRELITGDFLLITNPSTVVNSTLSTQIAEFRKRRRENADNVMTLLYSSRENSESSLLGVSSETSKLMLYPGANSLNQLKAEKRDFHEEVEIRRDLTSTGLAFCSRLIATQFSDNFDFINIHDVVREILSKDDILGMSVHVEVLTPKERAFYAYDYESLVLLNILMLERWFYPLVPESADLSRYFTSNPRNIYLEEDGNEISIKANPSILNDLSSNVSLGVHTKVAYDSILRNSSVGGGTEIGSRSQISGSIIGKNCRIGENCVIECSFIGDNVQIPSGARISKESIVGNGVIYPKELPHIPRCAVLAEPVDEEKFDKLSSKKVGSVHVAQVRYDAPFWRRAVNGRTNFAVDESDSESEEEEDDENGADGVDDSTRQFHDEVLESMQKILESEEQQMRNLILEINSSKLACNVSMDDVARNVFSAFMKLPGNENLKTMCDLVVKWKPLFLNYYKSSEAALAAMPPARRALDVEMKKKCQIQLLLSVEDKFELDPEVFGPKVPKLVHYLYNNADVLDEEAILEWAGTIAEQSELRNLMRPIVDWLQEDEDEDEEEEE